MYLSENWTEVRIQMAIFRTQFVYRLKQDVMALEGPNHSKKHTKLSGSEYVPGSF
jgi:hypothetical protein